MRVSGVLLTVGGLVLLTGLQFVGRSVTRAHDAWSTSNKSKAALAGVVGIVAGFLLLMGGVN